jgi:hypothetical protein
MHYCIACIYCIAVLSPATRDDVSHVLYACLYLPTAFVIHYAGPELSPAAAYGQ